MIGHPSHAHSIVNDAGQFVAVALGGGHDSKHVFTVAKVLADPTADDNVLIHWYTAKEEFGKYLPEYCADKSTHTQLISLDTIICKPFTNLLTSGKLPQDTENEIRDQMPDLEMLV